MTARRARPPRRDQVALAGAGLLLGAIWIGVTIYSSAGHLSAALDDTFIHLQYARQIAAGHFFAYNTADGYSSGATSFLYALLLAAVACLGLDGDALLWAAQLLNAGFFAASAVLVYRLTWRWAGRRGGLVAGLLFLLNGGILWGYGTGMEIGLFGLLLLAGLSVVAGGEGVGGGGWGLGRVGSRRQAVGRDESVSSRQQAVGSGDAGAGVGGWGLGNDSRVADDTVPNPKSPIQNPKSADESAGHWSLVTDHSSTNPKSKIQNPKSALWAALVLAALALTRPEAVAMVGAAAGLLAWGAARRPGPGRWALAGVAAGAAVLGLLPLGLNLLYTGHVTPNAAAAKLILYEYPEIHPLHVAYIWARRLTLLISDTFLQTQGDAPFFGYALLLAGLGGFRRAGGELGRRSPGPFLIGTAWLLTSWALAASLQPVQQNRYLIAGYPLFIVFMVVGMADLARFLARRQGRPGRRHRARAIFLGLATLIVAAAIGGAVRMIATLGENAADIYRQQVALGHWIAAYLPADARIAINDAGAMKYYGNRYTVDLVGLTSNDLAGLRHLGDAPIFDQLLARPLAQRPDYFIVYDSWFPELVRLPGFLTEIHRTHLLHNTVTSGDDVPVYQAHWEAIHTADQPLLDHRADDTEQPAAKVVVTGGLGSDPVYLAHLVLPAAHGVTLRAEAAGAARLDYLELVEDGSSQATRLVAAGLPLSATATLPAGSYRLYAAGQLPAGAPLTVRLLTPDLRLGLPAKGPAPRRQLVDQLDLGNLAAEQAHAYTIGTGHWDVYPTTLLKSATYAAAPATPYVDTGRSVPGWQQMTVATTPGRALKLVLRYLSPGAQRVQVAVDGQDAGLWFYPGTAGWGEAEFVVPAPLITQAHTRLQLTLVPDAAGHPLDGFYLWFYQ